MPASRETLATRIRAGMQRAGLSQQKLAESVGLDPSALSRALTCQRNFKSLEVALIAEKLGVTVQSLLAEEEEQRAPELLAARAQPATSPALQSALERTDEILELDRLLSDVGFPSAVALPSFGDLAGSPHQQGEELAIRVRREMGCDDDHLPYDLAKFADLLERTLGIDVAFEPLPAGLDGLSVSTDGFCLALVSSGISGTRQRFTLAHEVGHLIAGDSQDLRIDESVLGRRLPDEERANSFAASFLMPARALRAEVPRALIDEGAVAELLGTYGVSLDALAFRLHNIGIVNAEGRDRMRRMSSGRIALRSGRTSDLQARGDRRAPGNLLYRAIQGYVQGKISVRPLASLLRVSPHQLLEELMPPSNVRRAESLDSMEPAL
ncbi:XRE family transcriptional regulator [Micromonospora sp. NPDC005237]|uniref:helix-turn-helix domain-containing protein n=1 Tax=Micromonospora sp. NPDC005237 TaxID=3155113 RepID=UPI0033B68102